MNSNVALVILMGVGRGLKKGRLRGKREREGDVLLELAYQDSLGKKSSNEVKLEVTLADGEASNLRRQRNHVPHHQLSVAAD